MTYLAQDVANFLLDYFEDNGFRPTNLWLNKVLFFLHSTHLVERGEPLIKNKFTAWQYGPVLRPIYTEFKEFGRSPIREKRARRLNPETGEMEYFPYNLDKVDMDFVRANLDPYIGKSASYLVEKSHEPGSPWDDIWTEAASNIVPGMTISDELILTKARYRLS